jgi:hypothetical protein
MKQVVATNSSSIRVFSVLPCLSDRTGWPVDTETELPQVALVCLSYLFCVTPRET